MLAVTNGRRFKRSPSRHSKPVRNAPRRPQNASLAEAASFSREAVGTRTSTRRSRPSRQALASRQPQPKLKRLLAHPPLRQRLRRLRRQQRAPVAATQVAVPAGRRRRSPAKTSSSASRNEIPISFATAVTAASISDPSGGDACEFAFAASSAFSAL